MVLKRAEVEHLLAVGEVHRQLIALDEHRHERGRTLRRLGRECRETLEDLSEAHVLEESLPREWR